MVPRFTPFPALRFSATDLDDLVAPPYDVLSDADLDELNARDRFNITHVDVPRESAGPGRYERAGETLRQWIDAGVMAFDDQPTFTLYRLRFTDATGAARSIVGVLGGLEVGPYGECGVLPHERITPKASTDRLDLTRATRANMSPIWGLSLADGLTDLLAEPGEAIASVTIDGVEHTVERVTDSTRIAAISAKIATDDVLIADGHHRYGVAQKFREEMRDATGSTTTDAEDTLVFVSELVDDQLSVEAIHRLYADVHVDDLVAALEEGFERSPGGTPSAATLTEMDRRGVLCLVRPDGSGEWLTPKPGAFDDLRALDGLWLEELLSGVEHSVTYQHGVDRCRRRRGRRRRPRGGADPPRQRCRDRAHSAGGRRDAAEVDVLHPQAPDGSGHPAACVIAAAAAASVDRADLVRRAGTNVSTTTSVRL